MAAPHAAAISRAWEPGQLIDENERIHKKAARAWEPGQLIDENERIHKKAARAWEPGQLIDENERIHKKQPGRGSPASYSTSVNASIKSSPGSHARDVERPQRASARVALACFTDRT